MSVTKCLWCSRVFTPRGSGGKRQRFCRPACLHALNADGLRYIEVALADGALTVSDLRNAPSATRARSDDRDAATRADTRPLPGIWP